MSSIIRKVKDSLQREGLLRTACKILAYPFNRIQRQRFSRDVLTLDSVEDRFTWIYKNHHWSGSESASGIGSSLRYTENLRRELPGLIARFSIRKIFDAPCGDFNWMQHLLPQLDVDYIGGDIVQPLIEAHRAKYGSPRISFIHVDLIRDAFPQADLMICRDCLFHLSYADTRAVLRNFIASGIPYLLTTTYRNDSHAFRNEDIQTGDFRLIDLFSPPYNFPAAPLVRIDDWVAPNPERQMCLWSRDQVAAALDSFR